MGERVEALCAGQRGCSAKRDRRIIVTALGITQILAWGSTFYLLAVLATPIVRDTGWPYDWVVAGVSIGLLVAGIVSPRVGREIKKRGGRSVLAGGAALIALGLLLMGLAPNFAWYLAAWVIVGMGMGAGLYDAAFATLGAIYGQESRGAISAVTLFGGFASTVCWPLSNVLVEQVGWRGACFVYAAIHAGLSVPTYMLALPRGASPTPSSAIAPPPQASMELGRNERPAFVVLGAIVTIGAAILAMMGAHLLQLLQAQGVSSAGAVALGMLIGPSAVGARVVEVAAGRYYHPIWTLTASAILTAAGTVLLLLHLRLPGLAIILYAAGNGIGSIARGTVPLALFGPARYPVLMGRLALPLLIAMALAPFTGALALRTGGAGTTLAVLVALAGINVLLVGLLWPLTEKLRSFRQS
jgi:MFS family permease